MESPQTRILIVEDNPDDGALLMRQLKKAQLGEQVKMIGDGRQALDFLMLAEADHLIAIFLDLKLPNLSGLSLLDKIRANDRRKHLPVIVMTSSNSPKDLEGCKELGVSSYVQKPVTFGAFSKAVADTFHRPSPGDLIPRMQES
jgi:two-component system response regulator